MNLYLISQNIVNGYDTYDSAVVSAETSEEARTIHPSAYVTHIDNNNWMGGDFSRTYINNESSWVRCDQLEDISVELLGTTLRGKGLIFSSFNAG